jgi:ATP-dependent metalloprotease
MKALMGSNDEIEMQKNVKTRFSDVQGIDEFKDELQDIVEFLKNPEKYIEAGAKLPKGILLTGPPGTIFKLRYW